MSFFAASGAGGRFARPYQAARCEAIREAKHKERVEKLSYEQAERNARRASRFEAFDEDSSGAISKAELKKALAQVKREVTGCPDAEVSDETLKLAWGARLQWETLDGQGLLRALDKFKHELAEEGAATRELFGRFDVDNSGGLSLDEFRALLNESASGAYSEPELRQMMGRADTDGDGEVTLAELNAALATWMQGHGARAKPRRRRAW